MKIIGVDNFNRELAAFPDILMAENVHLGWISRIVLDMNERQPEDSTYFFRQVPDDYILQDYDPR